MESNSYSIRKSFLLPLGLVFVLCLVLLACSVYLRLPTAKIIILSSFLVPVGLIFAESSYRRVQVDDQAVQVSKLFRNKRINYNELTAIDTIQVRKRAFISLSSENDFMILSNSYQHFDRLIKQLVTKVPESVVSEDTRRLANNPPRKCSDTFSAWLAVAVLALIIYVQLRGVL